MKKMNAIPKRNSAALGFSLIEVLLSLLILTAVIVPLVSLIPIGLKNTQISSEEMYAAHLLTAVIQDLRYSSQTSLKSEIFKISPLPYGGATTGALNKFWVDDCWTTSTVKNQRGLNLFQLELKYLKVAPTGSFDPVEAKITIRWPPKLNAGPEGKAPKGGEISSVVIFPRNL